MGRGFQQNKQKKRKNEKQRGKREKRSIQHDVVGKKTTYILTDSLSSKIDEAPVDSVDSLALIRYSTVPKYGIRYTTARMRAPRTNQEVAS